MSIAGASGPGLRPALGDGVVTLRSLRADDVTNLTAYAQDRATARWTSVPQPYSAADAANFVAQVAQGWDRQEAYHLAVETEGRFAGVLGLSPRGSGLAEIGFGLVPWARGRGVMTRALRLMIPWGFEEAQVDVLHWRAQVGNWASRRVAWAVGFKVEGEVPGLVEHRGRRIDGWLAALGSDAPLRPAHPWFDPPVIAGPGFVLRALRDADVPRIAEAGADPDTQHWLSGKPDPYNEDDAFRHLRSARSQQAEGKVMFFAVADPGDDRLLGEVGLFLRDLGSRQGEVGYWAHPDARGRGLTTAAVRLAVRHALLPVEEGGLGLVRVLLRTGAGNLASQRVALNAGFTRTGLDRSADRRRDGRFADTVRFDLLATELPPVR